MFEFCPCPAKSSTNVDALRACVFDVCSVLSIPHPLIALAGHQELREVQALRNGEAVFVCSQFELRF